MSSGYISAKDETGPDELSEEDNLSGVRPTRA